MKPQRIQLSRRKGWSMPENTVRVARPGPYGNKFAIGHHYRRGGLQIPRMWLSAIYIEAFDGYQDDSYTTIRSSAEAVEWFTWYLQTLSRDSLERQYLAPLRGKNLACWCAIGSPCHADILLELANK